MRTTLLPSLGLLITLSATTTAQGPPPLIASSGQTFASPASLVGPSLLQAGGRTCATPPFDPRRLNSSMFAPSDCSYTSTTIRPEYDPGVIYNIPVVVHVIQKTSGTGYISPAMVQSQIDILNEDFLALPGTNGSPGTDAQLQFALATVDPSGNPTTGITYSTNNTWFNDGGGYWNSLAWDTNNYLNIYTNSASGAVGYVPDLPQGGIVGTNADRVVVLWSSFGRNAPIGHPFNQGRTTTHELGHYFGLYHTFDGGCGGGNCYTSADRICDTNAESAWTNGCPGNKTSCGSPDPIHNYMDYSNDTCMWEFTPEQVNRIRCTLENWRPDLADAGSSEPGTPVCFGDGTGAVCPCFSFGGTDEGCANSTGVGSVLLASGSNSVATDDLVLHASQAPPNKAGLFLQGGTQIANPVLDGILCVGNPTRRLELVTTDGTGDASSTLSIVIRGGVVAGQTRIYQFWYRDPSGLCGNGSNLSSAYEVLWQ